MTRLGPIGEILNRHKGLFMQTIHIILVAAQEDTGALMQMVQLVPATDSICQLRSSAATSNDFFVLVSNITDDW